MAFCLRNVTHRKVCSVTFFSSVVLEQRAPVITPATCCGSLTPHYFLIVFFLSDFLSGKHFFLYGKFPNNERRLLLRYIVAFNGWDRLLEVKPETFLFKSQCNKNKVEMLLVNTVMSLLQGHWGLHDGEGAVCSDKWGLARLLWRRKLIFSSGLLNWSLWNRDRLWISLGSARKPSRRVCLSLETG